MHVSEKILGCVVHSNVSMNKMVEFLQILVFIFSGSRNDFLHAQFMHVSEEILGCVIHSNVSMNKMVEFLQIPQFMHVSEKILGCVIHSNVSDKITEFIFLHCHHVACSIRFRGPMYVQQHPDSDGREAIYEQSSGHWLSSEPR